MNNQKDFYVRKSHVRILWAAAFFVALIDAIQIYTWGASSQFNKFRPPMHLSFAYIALLSLFPTLFILEAWRRSRTPLISISKDALVLRLVPIKAIIIPLSEILEVKTGPFSRLTITYGVPNRSPRRILLPSAQLSEDDRKVLIDHLQSLIKNRPFHGTLPRNEFNGFIFAVIVATVVAAGAVFFYMQSLRQLKLEVRRLEDQVSNLQNILKENRIVAENLPLFVKEVEKKCRIYQKEPLPLMPIIPSELMAPIPKTDERKQMAELKKRKSLLNQRIQNLITQIKGYDVVVREVDRLKQLTSSCKSR